MGTNYYVEFDRCSCCGHQPEQLHIGKSSGGWTFSFQAHNDPKIHTYADYKEYLKDKRIVDEYGREVSFQSFKKLVASKVDAPNNHTLYNMKEGDEDHMAMHEYFKKQEYLDPEGHSFSKYEFG